MNIGEKWTALWNGDFGLAHEIIDPDFRIRFGSGPGGDGLRGPDDFAGFIKHWHEIHPGLVFELEIPQLEAGSEVVLRWRATWDDVPEGHSGIDQLTVVDGRVTRAWSVTGARAFTPMG
jgi:hypothetical protein